MASPRGDALVEVRAELIKASRAGAAAKTKAAVLEAAAAVAKATALIAALEKIGLMGTRLHAI